VKERNEAPRSPAGRNFRKAILTASLARAESRGSFNRKDFPREDNINWQKNSCLIYDRKKRVFPKPPPGYQPRGQINRFADILLTIFKMIKGQKSGKLKRSSEGTTVELES